MLPSQVVERCRELGAGSAQLVSGSMEDMAFAKRVVEAAEAELGTSAACSPPASGRLEMLELSSTLLFVTCPLRKNQYLRRKTQEKWGWGEVCPNSAPCSPALPLCPACTTPAQAELRSQFHLGALVTSCPSLTILDFITAGYCGLKPPVRPAAALLLWSWVMTAEMQCFSSVQSTPSPNRSPLTTREQSPLCHIIRVSTRGKKSHQLSCLGQVR